MLGRQISLFVSELCKVLDIIAIMKQNIIKILTVSTRSKI